MIKELQNPVESLTVLDDKYHVINKLGQGANDSAYLVQNEEQQSFVALTPIDRNNEWAWLKTMNKGNVAQSLTDLGLGEYIVKAVEGGTLQFESSRHRVVITEFAGADISHLATEPEKLSAIMQMAKIVFAFHEQHVSINDFKDEHWCFKSSAAAGIKLKLIDYTQVRIMADQPEANFGMNDLYSIMSLLTYWFPWYDFSGYTHEVIKNHATFQTYIEQVLQEIQTLSKEYSPARKRVLTFQNDVKGIMTAIKKW